MRKYNKTTLTKAISIALLVNLPAVAIAADTYGVNASNENIIISNKDIIENVNYGVLVSNGYNATVNAGDLTINADKAAAYIKEKNYGTINLNTSVNLNANINGGGN